MRTAITGASIGIGRATAERLAGDGAELVLHYRSHRAEIERLARDLATKGTKVETVGADLRVPDEVDRFADAVRNGGDALDALVLNAGAYPRRPFRELSDAEWRECFELNVFAPARIVQRLLPLLERSGSGRVVFVSSVLAFAGSTHGAHYAGAKAALLGLSRSLARELAPKVTVNVVAPGAIDTAILAGDSPAARIARERTIPLGRVGAAREVAEAIAFLASPSASYITGTTLHVNGGSYLA